MTRSRTSTFVGVIAAGLVALAPTAVPAEGSGLPFSEELAELGDVIFDDEDLSIGRNQGCNACHSVEWGFTGPDGDVNAHGAMYEGSIPGRFGDRKPPSSAYSTLSPVLHLARREGGTFVGGNFFDGRATGEKLGNPAADQAQGPFLNPVEQGLRDSACVVYRVSVADYAEAYKQLWGSVIETIEFPPDIDDLCSMEGPPLAIAPVNRAKIEQEFDNVAISLAVYEESHNLFSSKFDAMRRNLYTFTPEERRGFRIFKGRGKCTHCHPSGGDFPAFTDHTYDNLGVPANPENPIYLTNPSFVDLGLGGFLAGRPEWASLAPLELGKVKVPTLRNVDLRPDPAAVKAYMHNGVFKSLEEVVRSTTRATCSPPAGPPRRGRTGARSAGRRPRCRTT